MIYPSDNLMVDMAQPVGLLNLLARGLKAFWVGVPGTQGGRRFMDFTDPGPNGIHATLAGSTDPTTVWVPGQTKGTGWGVQFERSNSEYATLTLPAFLATQHDYTVVSWFQLLGASTAWRNSCLWYLRESANGDADHFHQLETVSGGALVYRISHDGAWTATTPALTEGTHVVACTYTSVGTDISVFVDGVETGPVDAPRPWVALVAGEFGRRGRTTPDLYSDNVILYMHAVYDRVLGFDEIQLFSRDPLAPLRVRRRLHVSSVAVAVRNRGIRTGGRMGGSRGIMTGGRL